MPHSDVEATNLNMLSTIKLGIEANLVLTSSKFALSAALAGRLRDLSQQQLLAFVVQVGQTTLFPPRDDLLALLDAPLALTGLLAAARAPRPAPASSPSTPTS